MTRYDDGDEWPRDPVSAVELLELLLLRPDLNPNPGFVEIPREIAAIILECARNGLHKGRGRRGVPLGHLEKMHKEAAVLTARKRKKELRAADPEMRAGKAAQQAAKEASEYLSRRYRINLAASTIVRRMR